MVFTERKCNTNDIIINICGSQVKQVSSLKFLGVTIDHKLNWSDHINVVCNTLAKNIGVIYRLKSLPKTILKMIYNSIVLPYLYYNIIAWGNSYLAYINKVIK